MSTRNEIVGALQDAGLHVETPAGSLRQGVTIHVEGSSSPLRMYAWEVTDNGAATGTVRPADERRIQASTSRPLVDDDDAETLVLGWSDGDFSDRPLLVAFNPHSVVVRINAKLEARVDARARVSDSQQFRQSLLDAATAQGMAVGQNQHGEQIVAFGPERFLEYVTALRPAIHSATGVVDTPPPGDSMHALIEAASIEQAEPADGVDAAQLPEFDPSSIRDGRERIAREIALRRGQAGFRTHLIGAYGARCMITGCTVEAAIEAAHIVAYQGPGSNHPANGLLLRADIHTLFDSDLIAIDADTLVVLVSPALAGTEYQVLHGQPLLVTGPMTPSRAALQVRRASVEF